MNVHRPRALAFDFGETLMHEGPLDALAGAKAVLKLATNPAGVTAERLAEALLELARDLDLRRQASLLEPQPLTWTRLVYEPMDIRFDVDRAEVEWAWWCAALPWTPEPGVVEMLALARALGIPWGIVGNTMFTGRTIERQLAASGLDGCRFVITSADHTVRKPHRRLFDLAARRHGVESSAVWFVGDSYENDILGAASAGLVPVWYRRTPDGRTDPAPAAHVVESWQSFGALLRGTVPARRD